MENPPKTTTYSQQNSEEAVRKVFANISDYITSELNGIFFGY
jgi:hypothetical protein